LPNHSTLGSKGIKKKKTYLAHALERLARRAERDASPLGPP
jgi:hypothetical protein